MGAQCSVAFPRPSDGLQACGPHGVLCSDEDCGCSPCTEEMSIGLQGATHPLIHNRAVGSASSPRTPRGPVPPWAVSYTTAVDRTATGATPPRSPTPPRFAPPGLPDDDIRSAANVLTLNSVFDAKFGQELFGAARSGNTSRLTALLQQVNSQALTLACSEQNGGYDAAMVAERYEQASDLVASFLGKARDSTWPHEPLLSTAARAGHVDAVQILLGSRSDPLAVDDQQCSALHRASSSGNLLVVLLILDRVQANLRSVNLAGLTNIDGETPEMFAALAGGSDICRAFEIFSNMQNDAELRQLGSSASSPDAAGIHRGPGTGDILTFIDMAADARSPAGLSASAMLRRSTMGSSLVQSMSRRIPNNEQELRQLIEQACHGILTAEEHLLSNSWNATDPSLDPVLRTFHMTAEYRCAWQRLRTSTVKESGSTNLDDFWQTHLTAELMVVTLRNAVGDTFQILLTVLWLYTREAWLRHVLDALATALHSTTIMQSKAGVSSSVPADAATGATPLCRSDIPGTLQSIAPLIDALGPCMQLVQSALGWFEEAGIRHASVTYRPLSLPMLGLQHLAEAVRHGVELSFESERSEQVKGDYHRSSGFGSNAWVSLGSGSFFSSLSSRSEAIRRLCRTRCNVLLAIRPDDTRACYPKHMSLRGSSMDDTLFPMNALFRITRMTKSFSSDLEPEVCSKANSSRWPVWIIELQSACRHVEAMEFLERSGNLVAGELEVNLQDWMSNAPVDEEQERIVAAREMLARIAGAPAGASAPLRPDKVNGSSEVTTQSVSQYAQLAEGCGNVAGVTHTLLAKARC